MLVVVVVVVAASVFTFIFFCFKSCDLAGSERIKKSGVKGERLSELQHLNLSLLELGYVETILYSRKNFVQLRIYFNKVSGRVFWDPGFEQDTVRDSGNGI